MLTKLLSSAYPKCTQLISTKIASNLFTSFCTSSLSHLNKFNIFHKSKRKISIETAAQKPSQINMLERAPHRSNKGNSTFC